MEDDNSSRRVFADRLGDLPDCLLHEVLSRLGSRQVVQTSVLSRRWRHLWRDVSCVDLDQREFDLDQWDTFEAFADHMLLRAAETPPLDAFRLSSTPNSWIRRGLERFPLAVDIRACFTALTTWPDMDLHTGAGSRLKRLRLLQVELPNGFGQRIGEQCPVIEELHLENCRSFELRGITSPTLRSLTVIAHHNPFSAGELVVAAPRLASLYLDVRNDGWAIVDLERAAHGEALGSLVAASICVQVIPSKPPGWGWGNQQKRHFWSSIRSLLGRAPNLINLQLQGFTTMPFLDEEFPELPVFHSLRRLLLQSCDVGANFEALTTILDNTPNLEKLGLHDCMHLSASPSSSKLRTSTQLVCKKKLKSVEINGGNELHLRHFLSEISTGEMPLNSLEKFRIKE